MRLLRAGCFRAFGVLCAWSSLIEAQQASVSLALGAARVRFEEQSAFTSTTLSPALSLRAAAFALSASGTFAGVGGAGWSTQGFANAALFSQISARGLMFEASGSFGGSSFPSGISTAQGLGVARLHWMGRTASGWVGAAAGSMYDGASWRGVRQAEFGATVSSTSERLTLLVTPSVTDDTLRYTDFLGVIGTALGSFDASFSLGGRSGAALPIAGGDRRLWGGAQLQWWWSPRAALTLGTGTYPVDVTQGFPAGEYLAVGLRLGERRSLTSQGQALSRRTRRAAQAAGVQAFTAHTADDGTIAIRVRATAASRVELASDLTRWEPVALTKDADGWWWLRLPHSDARVAEVALRVDGGPWIAPPGTAPMRDEFGGVSGRLVLKAGM